MLPVSARQKIDSGKKKHSFHHALLNKCFTSHIPSLLSITLSCILCGKALSILHRHLLGEVSLATIYRHLNQLEVRALATSFISPHSSLDTKGSCFVVDSNNSGQIKQILASRVLDFTWYILSCRNVAYSNEIDFSLKMWSIIHITKFICVWAHHVAWNKFTVVLIFFS